MTTLVEPDTFRPSMSRAIAVTVIGLCMFAAIGVVGEGGRTIFHVWPWLALVGLVSWAIYWRPKIVVSEGGVLVVNIARTIEIPWPAIDDIETQWALTLQTEFGSVRAWAAPAPGRQVMRRLRPEDRRIGGRRPGESVRPSDLPSTESGAAAVVVQQTWKRLHDAGHLDSSVLEFDRLRIVWHWGLGAAFAVVAALCVASLVV